MLTKTLLLLCLFTAAFTGSIVSNDFDMNIIDVGDEDSILDNMFLQYSGACAKGGLLIQTGAVWKSWWNTSSEMEKNSAIVRRDVIAVQFEETFQTTPQVAIALKGFDLKFSNAGIHIYAEAITASGFNVVVEAPLGALVYAAQVSWIATLSHTTKIWFHKHSISVDNNQELREKTVGQGDRAILQKFKYSRELTNPGLFTAIAGFEFGAGRNIRLSVEPTEETTKGFRLSTKTWWDTTWEAADYLIIVFEKSVAESFIVQSSTTGAMYNGADVRQETKYHPLVSDQVQLFTALSYIDFIDGHNYRLTAESKVTGGNVELKLTTWADTQVFLVHHYVLAFQQKPKHQITQTGVWTKVYWNTSHVFESGNGDRVENYDITFPTAFYETPSVGIALTGIDLDFANAAVKTEVTSVSTDKFSIRVTAPNKAKVYYVQLQWIATISSYSGIYINTIYKWADAPEISRIKTGMDLRTATFYSANPGTAVNPGVVANINSFAFGANNNARFKITTSEIDASGAKITFNTWYNTVFLGGGATIVHYDKDCGNGHIQLQSTSQGVLYKNSGERLETKTGEIGFSGATLWAGFWYIDFISGYNYRLTQDFTLSNNVVTANMRTWSDTDVWVVMNNIFYTDPYRYTAY